MILPAGGGAAGKVMVCSSDSLSLSCPRLSVRFATLKVGLMQCNTSRMYYLKYCHNPRLKAQIVGEKIEQLKIF